MKQKRKKSKAKIILEIITYPFRYLFSSEERKYVREKKEFQKRFMEAYLNCFTEEERSNPELAPYIKMYSDLQYPENTWTTTLPMLREKALQDYQVEEERRKKSKAWNESMMKMGEELSAMFATPKNGDDNVK